MLPDKARTDVGGQCCHTAGIPAGGSDGGKGRAMEFAMFHEFRCAPGSAHTDVFISAYAEIDAAERTGLDVIWLGELHMDPERSVLSSPLTVASAIAARTSRIRIGTAVQVLPLAHPVRIAEAAATVDQISQGRLIFGVGRNGLPRGYDAYDVSYAESQERFAEALALIKRALYRVLVSGTHV